MISVQLLGGFRVLVGGRAVPDAEWRRRSAAQLVALLALSPGRRLHRERVLAALWPDADPAEASPRLHKAAHYARRALGGTAGALVLAGEVVALCPDDAVEVDAVGFEERARAALAARDAVLAAGAADAYRGELLPDDPYAGWTEEPRERLRLLHLDVLRLAGRWAEVAEREPADEQAHVALARRLAAAGDRAAALRQFERLERALSRELGVDLGPAAARLRASLLAGRDDPAVVREAELIGRDDELAWTRAVFARVRQGAGRMVFLSGPAGVGKSSLLAAVEADVAAAGMRVGSGLAARIDGAWPYAPVLEALADLSRRHPALLDGLDDAMRGELERALSGRGDGWNGSGGHQRLFTAAAELLRLAAAGAGAVLVVDDAHGADEASLRLLHYLHRATVADRVAVVLGHRPVHDGVLAEVRGAALGRGSATSLELRPLRPPDALALARRHAPAAPMPALQAVAAAAAGLPFSVVEGARAVGADPAAPPGAALLPPDLPDDVLRAMGPAAVLGLSFDTDEFVELTGLDDDDAYAVLEAATAGRLLRRTAQGFAFRHGLQREALLARWTGPRGRQAAHLSAARALQRLDRSPGRIGFHLIHGGAAAEAVPWVLRAAQTQAALGAYRDALATLEQVRAVVTGEDVGRLLALRADLLGACGDLAAVAAYREALGVVDDPALRARVRIRMAHTATQHGDLETAALALDGLLLGGTDDAELLVARGSVALFRGHLADAAAAAEEARRRIELDEPAEGRLFDLITLQGLLAHFRGEWFQRLRGELRTGAERPELASRLFDSHLCVAEFLLYGPTPYDEVLGLAAQLRRTAERAGVKRAVAFAVALRGEAALLMGDLDLAEAELAEAADLHRALESPAGEAVSLQRLAEVKVHRGDPATARHLLRRALLLARWSVVAQCLMPRVHGTMVAAAEDVDRAVAAVEQAEASLGPDDMCPFCTIMLAVPAARALAAAGDLAAARRWLARAEIVGERWAGTSWDAALIEVRAALAAAEGRPIEAGRLYASAAALFDSSGQPFDAARCRDSLLAARR